MAVSKSERMLNLTICLLSTRRFLGREQIRQAVAGYADAGDAAFERTFERDKDELRALGVPIQTGSNDRYFDDEVGYRIDPASFELPPVELSAAEVSVVALAAQAFDAAGVRESSQGALAKLRAAGVDVDQPTASGVAPFVSAHEPAFEPLWEALVERVAVRFDYPDRNTGKRARRTVEPWSITSRRGGWYLVGFDRDREDRRVFKLSRMGAVKPFGKPGAFVIPEDADLLRVVTSEVGPQRTARLALRPGRAPALRRRGTETGERVADRDVLELAFDNSADLVAEVAGHGPDVLLLDPPDLRERVIARLGESAARRNGVSR